MNEKKIEVLPLGALADRHYGLIPSIANSFLDSARVCLDRHHQTPAEAIIHLGAQATEAQVQWEPADDRTRAALANRDDATRDGAYGCVIAGVELALGLYAVQRAETKTGADYYVAPVDGPLEDMENCWRLEVSGVDKGNEAVIARRLREKVQQTKDGNSNLPAIAGVIGFEALKILLELVDKP